MYGCEALSTLEAFEKNLIDLFEAEMIDSPSFFICPNSSYKTRKRPANERRILTDCLLRPVDLTYVCSVNRLTRIYTSFKFREEGNKLETQLNAIFCH
jgi:hypothetical protein